MKNKRVIFGSSVEYYDPSMGLKEWDRPTIEFDIEDGEDFLENLHRAKAIIKEFYRGNIKPLHSKEDIDATLPKTQAFIDLINSKYQTKKTLESLKSKVEAENNPELTEAYHNKLKELS